MGGAGTVSTAAVDTVPVFVESGYDKAADLFQAGLQGGQEPPRGHQTPKEELKRLLDVRKMT